MPGPMKISGKVPRSVGFGFSRMRGNMGVQFIIVYAISIVLPSVYDLLFIQVFLEHAETSLRDMGVLYCSYMVADGMQP